MDMNPFQGLRDVLPWLPEVLSDAGAFSSEPFRAGLSCGRTAVLPQVTHFWGGPAPVTGAPHPSLAWGDREGLL